MTIIKGKWPEPSHQEKHQRLFDNLIVLLSDLDNSMNPEVNHGAVIPRDEKGNVQWDQVSVKFLIQWSMLNAAKIGHEHSKEKNDIAPSGTN
jgi:hypothetical protein